MVSLFTGAGGFDIALERAGWDVIAATDNAAAPPTKNAETNTTANPAANTASLAVVFMARSFHTPQGSKHIYPNGVLQSSVR